MTTPSPAPMQLLHMVTGYYVPQLLYVAAALDLADHIAAGRSTTVALATATQTHAPSLERLLRALASVGIVTETAGGWALTPLGAGLRSDGPDSQRAWVLLYGGVQQRAWGELLYSIQTGQPAFAQVFGQPFYDYMAAHPDIAALTDAAMDQSVGAWLRDVVQLPLWDNAQRVTDVGGGHGALLAQLLAAHPQLRGVVFDLPHVVAGAPPLIEAAGVAARCAILAGDMLTAVPGGSDCYVLSRVLLNWNDDDCVTILRNCRAALPATGRLLIIDAIAPDEALPAGVALWDIFLLVNFGARVRRRADFVALLHAADLELVAVYPTASQFSVLEAR